MFMGGGGYIVGYTVRIMFFGSVPVLEQNLISNHIPDNLPPQMKILNSYFLNVTHFGVDISLFLENLKWRVLPLLYLTLFILMDFPKHIDTFKSMEYSILCFKRSQVEISKL